MTALHHAFVDWHEHVRRNRARLEALREEDAARAGSRPGRMAPRTLLSGAPSHSPGGAPSLRPGSARTSVDVRRGIAMGSQAAVVKLASFAGGRTRVGALLNYQSREGELQLEREDGRVVQGAAAVRALAEKWDDEGGRRKPSRDVLYFAIAPATERSEEEISAALAQALSGHKYAWRVAARDGAADIHVVASAASAEKDEKGKARRLYDNKKSINALQARLENAFHADVALEERGWAHGVDGAGRLLCRLTRDGAAPAVASSGQKLDTREANWEIANAWKRSLRSQEQRDVAHIIISAKPGTDREAFVQAARATLRREFAGHEYAFALHTDRQHLHLHAVVRVINANGERLHPDIADLRRWRATMAEEARERNILMEAASRFEQAHPPAYKLRDIKMLERGNAPEHVRRRVEAVQTNAIHVPTRPEGRERARQAVNDWRALSAAPPFEPEPPRPSDTFRLYRADPPGGHPHKQMLFTADYTSAQQIAAKQGGSTITYLDIPNAARSKLTPSREHPETLFVVPEELAARRRELRQISEAEILPFRQRVEMAQAGPERRLERTAASPTKPEPQREPSTSTEIADTGAASFEPPLTRGAVRKDGAGLSEAAAQDGQEYKARRQHIKALFAQVKDDTKAYESALERGETYDLGAYEARQRERLASLKDTATGKLLDPATPFIEALTAHLNELSEKTKSDREIDRRRLDAPGQPPKNLSRKPIQQEPTLANIDLMMRANKARFEALDGLEAALPDDLRDKFAALRDKLRTQSDEVIARARLQEASRPQMTGEAYDPPRARDVVGFTHKKLSVGGQEQVHYVHAGRYGAAGAVAFVDKGGNVVVHDWKNETSVLEAMKLSVEKWGTISITGNQQYKDLAIQIAVENGFEITNPELQDRIIKARERVASEKPPAQTAAIQTGDRVFPPGRDGNLTDAKPADSVPADPRSEKQRQIDRTERERSPEGMAMLRRIGELEKSAGRAAEIGDSSRHDTAAAAGLRRELYTFLEADPATYEAIKARIAADAKIRERLREDPRLMALDAAIANGPKPPAPTEVHNMAPPAKAVAERQLGLEIIRERVDTEARRETRQANAAQAIGETNPATGDAAHPYRSQPEARAAREAARSEDNNQNRPMPDNPAQSEAIRQAKFDQEKLLKDAAVQQRGDTQPNPLPAQQPETLREQILARARQAEREERERTRGEDYDEL
jgi:hypothetical protein